MLETLTTDFLRQLGAKNITAMTAKVNADAECRRRVAACLAIKRTRAEYHGWGTDR
jgi:hypothetical protein